MPRSRLLVLSSLLVVAGCLGADHTGPADTTSTGDIPNHMVLYAASPTTIIGLPGDIVSDPPAVQVAYSPSGKAAAGVKVSFTFSDGRGGDYTATTNSSGTAILENLRFDTQAGRYDIVASVPGVGSVAFRAMSHGGVVVATYDMRSIGGRQGPPFDLGEGVEIPGFHYQLFEDGTYWAGTDVAARTADAYDGYYERPKPGVIEFHLDPAHASSPFYVSRNYLFAVGTLTGDVMKVTHQDYVDFEDEEYVLSK